MLFSGFQEPPHQCIKSWLQGPLSGYCLSHGKVPPLSSFVFHFHGPSPLASTPRHILPVSTVRISQMLPLSFAIKSLSSCSKPKNSLVGPCWDLTSYCSGAICFALNWCLVDLSLSFSSINQWCSAITTHFHSPNTSFIIALKCQRITQAGTFLSTCITSSFSTRESLNIYTTTACQTPGPFLDYISNISPGSSCPR